MADIAEDVIPELMAASASGDALALAKDCMNQIPPDTYSAAMQCIVTFEGRDNLPKITLPTLVLAGDQDRNAPASMMEKMASKIPGAEYVLLTDTGHLAPIENAQGFNSTVLEFVQRHQHRNITHPPFCTPLPTPRHCWNGWLACSIVFLILPIPPSSHELIFPWDLH